ncbi:MAG: hypothetical protein PHW00_03940 [Clostridia bacterium]|nr:hypothetical protein [Clostridia bacterium]
MKNNYTPKSLFTDTDIGQLPFDKQVVKSHRTKGVTVEYIYFTGRKCEDGISIIYGVIAYQKLNQPAIIFIGEIGKRIDEDNLIYWARQGYTTICIDYAGDMGQGAHTIYPDSIFYANLNQAGRYLRYVDYDAKRTTWYEYDYNTLRAISLLEKEYGADKIVLCSQGGKASKVAVHTLAFNSNICSGAIAFGNVWEEYNGNRREIDGMTASQLTDSIEKMEEEERWLAGICTQTYLVDVHQPVFLITGANSTKTNMLDNRAGMSRCPNRYSRSWFVPNLIDNIVDEVRKNLQEWFQLTMHSRPVPPEPKVSIKRKEGRITAVAQGSVDNTSISYALSLDDKKGKYWITPALDTEEDCVKTDIVVYDSNATLTIFANTTNNGFTCSSEPLSIKLGNYSNLVEQKLPKLLYANTQDITQFMPIVIDNNQVYTVDQTLKIKKGAFNIKGCAGRNIATFALGQYAFDTIKDCSLSMDIYSAQPQDIEISYVVNWGESNQEIFTKTVNLVGGQLWQKIILQPREFKTKIGKVGDVQSSSNISVLIINAPQEVCINNVIFV